MGLKIIVEYYIVCIFFGYDVLCFFDIVILNFLIVGVYFVGVYCCCCDNEGGGCSV